MWFPVLIFCVYTCRRCPSARWTCWSMHCFTGGQGWGQSNSLWRTRSPSHSGRGGKTSRVKQTGNSSTTSMCIYISTKGKKKPMCSLGESHVHSNNLNYYQDVLHHWFFVRFMQDHATSALIWNYKTREELREALENEIRSFTVDKVMLGILYCLTSFSGCCTKLHTYEWFCYQC